MVQVIQLIEVIQVIQLIQVMQVSLTHICELTFELFVTLWFATCNIGRNLVLCLGTRQTNKHGHICMICLILHLCRQANQKITAVLCKNIGFCGLAGHEMILTGIKLHTEMAHFLLVKICLVCYITETIKRNNRLNNPTLKK